MTAPGRGAAGAAALLAALACNPSRALYQAGLPGVTTSFSVAKVVERGGYLDTILQGRAGELRVFAPADETCAAVLAPEASVAFASEGAGGKLERNGQVCRGVGRGSLAEWRERRARPENLETAVPRAQASYRVVYRDADVVFLRGRFPLAALIGWAEVGDSIAVVPDTEICREPIEAGVASLEYRPVGPNVLALVTRRGLCPIEGLLQPLPGS
ncbi:MAG TPA: hypothetical protein VFG80_08810 [Myxococcota bacterium]|nr:hypothetical protein [Myxococcota bacterium]